MFPTHFPLKSEEHGTKLHLFSLCLFWYALRCLRKLVAAKLSLHFVLLTAITESKEGLRSRQMCDWELFLAREANCGCYISSGTSDRNVRIHQNKSCWQKWPSFWTSMTSKVHAQTLGSCRQRTPKCSRKFGRSWKDLLQEHQPRRMQRNSQSLDVFSPVLCSVTQLSSNFASWLLLPGCGLYVTLQFTLLGRLLLSQTFRIQLSPDMNLSTSFSGSSICEISRS